MHCQFRINHLLPWWKINIIPFIWNGQDSFNWSLVIAWMWFQFNFNLSGQITKPYKFIFPNQKWLAKQIK